MHSIHPFLTLKCYGYAVNWQSLDLRIYSKNNKHQDFLSHSKITFLCYWLDTLDIAEQTFTINSEFIVLTMHLTKQNNLLFLVNLPFPSPSSLSQNLIFGWLWISIVALTDCNCMLYLVKHYLQYIHIIKPHFLNKRKQKWNTVKFIKCMLIKKTKKKKMIRTYFIVKVVIMTKLLLNHNVLSWLVFRWYACIMKVILNLSALSAFPLYILDASAKQDNSFLNI